MIDHFIALMYRKYNGGDYQAGFVFVFAIRINSGFICHKVKQQMCMFCLLESQVKEVVGWWGEVMMCVDVGGVHTLAQKMAALSGGFCTS